MAVQLSRNQMMAAGGAAIALVIAGVYLGRVSTRRAADAAATQGAATQGGGATAPGAPGAATPAGAGDAQPTQTGPKPGELTWVKPGLRLTYYTASARVNGRHTELVLDENGEWEVVDTGEVRAEVEKDDRASGQAYAQVNVTDISDGTAALEFRTYNIEVGTNAIALPNYGGWVGAVSASDLWKAPSELQQMRDEKTKERKVERYTPTINGRKYNAIRIHTQTGNGSTQYTYDLESGVLLLEGMSATGGAD